MRLFVLLFLAAFATGCAYIDVPTAVRFGIKDILYPLPHKKKGAPPEESAPVAKPRA